MLTETEAKQMARMSRQVKRDVRSIRKYVTLYAGYITEALEAGDLEEAMHWAQNLSPLTSTVESSLERMMEA